MKNIDMFLNNNGYEFVEELDSGYIMTDGGSCTGHWYDMLVKVVGTNGTLRKLCEVRVCVSDGYVMEGNHTGPINSDPEYWFEWEGEPRTESNFRLPSRYHASLKRA